MSIDFLPPLQPVNVDALASAAASQTAPAMQAPGGPNFGQLVSQGLQSVNQQLQASQVDLQRLASGDAENLHHVMLKLEESRLSFQLMLQVRNRLLESYQEIMRMQV
ncbi:MAG: flagellar hook-basal body complex protein FliE [Rhizobacter sp.]|nr:flagellar hook-basal body complex protein FliE [Rhizobacter sp.]